MGYFITFVGEVPKDNQRIMSIKTFTSIILSFLFLGLGAINTSCKSRKAVCDANSQYKSKKIKKNRSNYNVKYGFKAKPVRKTYVIRNR
jgi:hypothetical protein